MKIRDRIKRLDRVPASELLPNPKNWRTHPQAQQDALRGILAEVGWCDALLVRETPEGLQIVDGHLRAEINPTEEVPVLVLDLDDAESNKVLGTFDPITDMAEADPAKLDALLREVETGSTALQEMLAALAEDAGLYSDDDSDGDDDDQEKSPVISFNLVFDSEDQQETWFKFLRELKSRYGDLETHGERLAAFIDENVCNV
jgi:ParB-like chromosome segregation protein Spo0J